MRTKRTLVTADHLDRGDLSLNADELDDKYNPAGGGEHPLFTRAHWRSDVACRVTIHGYWKWVSQCITDANADGIVMANLH